MRELDLDALLKEKREEPISVSISAVDSWLKGGIAVVGLFATIKWLFTKKTWLMLTSISSISIATTLALLLFNTTPSQPKQHTRKETAKISQNAATLPSNMDEKIVGPVINKIIASQLDKMLLLQPNLVSKAKQNDLKIPEPKSSSTLVTNPDNDLQFTRINANGFVHFTLVKGTSCSIQNTIPTMEYEPQMEYSIKNGILFLNSGTENKASDLIITVSDLEKINLNGFCEMVTNTVYNAEELDLEINGFTNLNIDLNVKDLEIEMNGETKGKLNLACKNVEFESTGFCNLEVNCDFEQSWIEVNGFCKVNFTGTSTHTTLELSGETAIEAEALISQDLVLSVSGNNKKLETTVTSQLDVEISGKNTVSINGAPKIVRQEVNQGSKLKIYPL